MTQRRFDELIHELLSKGQSVSEYMEELLKTHVESYPEGDWKPFFEIEYDEADMLAERWFKQLIRINPPAQVNVKALRFGLYNPIVYNTQLGEEETVVDLYVSGSQRFELDSFQHDWATDPEYYPEGRYAHSRALADIYRAAYGPVGGLQSAAEMGLCLGYSALVVRLLMGAVSPDQVLSSEDDVAVTVGWDSGAPLYLGFMTTSGFVLRPPAEAIAGIRKQRDDFQRWFEARESVKWRHFEHTDGRRWSIGVKHDEIILRIIDEDGDEFTRNRPTDEPDLTAASLVAAQIADGFVEREV